MTERDERLERALKIIEEKLGSDDFTVFSLEEASALRSLVDYAPTLVEMARYEQATKLVWQAKKSAVLTAAALVSAGLVLWQFGSEMASLVKGLFE